MKISDKGLDLIREYEGFSPVPYQDAAKYWTIGWGHLIKKDEKFDRITQEQGKELLKKDLEPVENTINYYTEVKLNQNQFDALCVFVYNIGTSAFIRSTLLKWLNDNRFNDIPQQFTRWNKASGRTLLGLARRRVAESQLFLS